MNMKKLSISLVGLLAVAVLGACSKQDQATSTSTSSAEQSMQEQASSSSSQDTATTIGAQVGQEAPDFTLQDMNGKTVKLSDYRGKKVYLKFWASWCGPCKKSMPELSELVAKNDRDFEILTVVAPGLQGEKDEEAFKTWYNEQSFNDVPVLFNPDGSSFMNYQIRSIPTEYLIDSQGKIGKIQLGTISNQEAEAAFKQMN